MDVKINKNLKKNNVLRWKIIEKSGFALLLIRTFGLQLHWSSELEAFSRCRNVFSPSIDSAKLLFIFCLRLFHASRLHSFSLYCTPSLPDISSLIFCKHNSTVFMLQFRFYQLQLVNFNRITSQKYFCVQVKIKKELGREPTATLLTRLYDCVISNCLFKEIEQPADDVEGNQRLCEKIEFVEWKKTWKLWISLKFQSQNKQKQRTHVRGSD